MKVKFFLVIAIFMLAIAVAHAQNIQSIDCDKLKDSNYAPKTNFSENDSICFYGSGISGDKATITLEGKNNENSQSKEVDVTNGVVTSAGGRKFSGVLADIYNIIISFGERRIEQFQEIIVKGRNNDEPPEEQQVPEFSTIAAIAVLAVGGFYISKRRKSVF